MDEIDARYEEAVQNLPKVEYQLDTLLWGLEEEKEMLVKDLGKGVADIERKVSEYRRNQRTVNHNRQRSCEAVHYLDNLADEVDEIMAEDEETEDSRLIKFDESDSDADDSGDEE